MHYMLYSGVGISIWLISPRRLDSHCLLGIDRRHSKVQLHRILRKHYPTQNHSFIVSVLAARGLALPDLPFHSLVPPQIVLLCKVGL